MDKSSGVLSDSSTKELEIIEFEMNKNKFGVNVVKVREIIQPLPITPIPHAHRTILGIIQLRGEVLPVISLEQALNLSPVENCDLTNEKFIVAELNDQKVVFHVHHVTQIHRIPLDMVEKPSELYAVDRSQIIGVIKQAEEIILLIDFEKIIKDINQ
ncbi:chemotaxis protein CheW [Lederbergia citrea]|uniref:chemotaxis protein CheW n=1 Tax=Lederbergia citrea TaxID=2833581 RepID=UPI001BC9E63D|nr:chemotaxis protein CheW [Lederbergia citrea]MBS4177306.1 purine-binding chemotaxis protein CheW [Lederbergia citrea]